jgi:hypothetical protein
MQLGTPPFGQLPLSRPTMRRRSYLAAVRFAASSSGPAAASYLSATCRWPPAFANDLAFALNFAEASFLASPCSQPSLRSVAAAPAEQPRPKARLAAPRAPIVTLPVRHGRPHGGVAGPGPSVTLPSRNHRQFLPPNSCHLKILQQNPPATENLNPKIPNPTTNANCKQPPAIITTPSPNSRSPLVPPVSRTESWPETP